MENNNLKLILPLFILIFIGAGLVVFYNRNKQSSTSTKNSNNSSEGIVLGSSTDNANSNGDTVTSAEQYNQLILGLRTPINKGFEDLSSKAKYTTLFPQEEIQKIISDTQNNISNAINQLTNLNIDSRFSTANSKHLQSLNLLLEAINSYEKAKKESDKKEAQRLSELFSYDIEQSNKIISEIKMPN